VEIFVGTENFTKFVEAKRSPSVAQTNTDVIIGPIGETVFTLTKIRIFTSTTKKYFATDRSGNAPRVLRVVTAFRKKDVFLTLIYLIARNGFKF